MAKLSLKKVKTGIFGELKVDKSKLKNGCNEIILTKLFGWQDLCDEKIRTFFDNCVDITEPVCQEKYPIPFQKLLF